MSDSQLDYASSTIRLLRTWQPCSIIHLKLPKFDKNRQIRLTSDHLLLFSGPFDFGPLEPVGPSAGPKYLPNGCRNPQTLGSPICAPLGAAACDPNFSHCGGLKKCCLTPCGYACETGNM